MRGSAGRGRMRFAFALAFAGAVGACAYAGTGIDEPVVRRLTWFSYVNGDDMRAGCVPGAGDRFRFIYNGIYIQQVRVYELAASKEREPLLRARVIGPADLSGWGIGRVSDSTGPWRGTSVEVRLGAEDVRRLVEALAESGAFAAPQIGLGLSSDAFYWIVAACREGQFHFNGYLWPSESFERLRFPTLALRLGQNECPGEPAAPPDDVRHPRLDQAREMDALLPEIGGERDRRHAALVLSGRAPPAAPASSATTRRGPPFGGNGSGARSTRRRFHGSASSQFLDRRSDRFACAPVCDRIFLTIKINHKNDDADTA